MEAVLVAIKNTLIFGGVLSVLIVVHEWGHYITARKLGVKVERFSLGFGTKLYSWHADGTEFMLCAIPMGGYVKMAGDERDNCTGDPGEFFSKSPGHRGLIVLNGPVVNFVMAYVCLVFVFVLGYPDLAPKIGHMGEGAPAETAGLLLDDVILKIDSQEVETWTEVQAAIPETTGESINLFIRREGQEMNLTVYPKIEEVTNVFGQKQMLRIVGIGPAEDLVILKYGWVESIGKGFDKLIEITCLTYKAIYHMSTGGMSAKENMTGPIGIFYIVTRAAAYGFSHLLYIVGIISASLAIFNLLPIIPLDGGHLFLLGIEKIRGKALSPKTDDFISRVGFGFIICLALFVFYSDFARFGWIDSMLNLWR